MRGLSRRNKADFYPLADGFTPGGYVGLGRPLTGYSLFVVTPYRLYYSATCYIKAKVLKSQIAIASIRGKSLGGKIYVRSKKLY
jgi:hypothetical protein